ncbi:MAG: Holliday junction branch migration protein RuvA [Bilifractor sp.]
MIGFIKGTIDEVGPDYVVVDNHGIGWVIYVPASLTDNELRTGDDVKLYTHMAVREDAITLYGFYSRDDLDVFRLLLGVSGIGPKAALGILSSMTTDSLRFAILADDAGAIAKAPGIGKKTAQKLILELKDKFRLDDAFEKKFAHDNPAGAEGLPSTEGGGTAADDAIQALVALGYTAAEALKAVRKVEPTDTMDSEDILKAALKFIF